MLIASYAEENLKAGAAGSVPYFLTVAANRLFFIAGDSESGRVIAIATGPEAGKVSRLLQFAKEGAP